VTGENELEQSKEFELGVVVNNEFEQEVELSPQRERAPVTGHYSPVTENVTGTLS
jgi:hypothetical protein